MVFHDMRFLLPGHTGILEYSDEFLFFRIDADNGFPLRAELFPLSANVFGCGSFATVMKQRIFNQIGQSTTVAVC